MSLAVLSSKTPRLLFPLPLPISSTGLHPLVGRGGKDGKPRGRAGSWSRSDLKPEPTRPVDALGVRHQPPQGSRRHRLQHGDVSLRVEEYLKVEEGKKKAPLRRPGDGAAR